MYPNMTFKKYFSVLKLTPLSILLITSLSFGKTDLYVFLFSGQSNMVGAGMVKDLPPELNKTFDKVQIYLCQGCDNSKVGKWLPLGPGFGGDILSMQCFGPELTFAKTLTDSMPDKEFALIKDAVSGTYLNQPYGWRPPSSGGVTGILYNNMMKHIDEALKTIDTSKYTIRMSGFVWLQGEFDAVNPTDAIAYETNLTNLINDIREKLNTDDLPVIIPLIDVQSVWTHNSIVRAAGIAVRNKFENVDTLDTKGFESDGIHYNANGLIKLGQIAAQRWLDLKYLDDPQTDITRYSKNTLKTVQLSSNQSLFFDLIGRKLTSGSIKLLNNRNASTFIIAQYENQHSKFVHIK